ncbi:MAG: 4-alpha-glucanotransferase [Bacilli bacterium]
MVNARHTNVKKAGLLMPVSSLPNRHGIGDFGPETFAFLKDVKRAGFGFWQILPLTPIGYGHSPYQPYSSLAMDEMYISLDFLVDQGLLTKVTNFRKNSRRVNYEKVRAFKSKYLHRAFKQAIKQSPTFIDRLIKRRTQFFEYAIFMSFKIANDDKPWNEWSLEQKNWAKDRKLDLSPYLGDICYQLFLQDVLIKQWTALKRRAHSLNLEIIGDLPFYVGHDSVDCFTNQNYFYLNHQGLPQLVSGVGPDYFSLTGQRWGNPIYNFPALKERNYEFLITRIVDCGDIYDYIRLDHFRAFDTYYVIDAKEETAEHGEWKLGPSYDFFNELFKTFDAKRIIAEDLGDIRREVIDLRNYYNFPGMNVMQFEILSKEKITANPHNVYYIGTHDNDTLKGWYLKLTAEERNQLRLILAKEGLKGDLYEQMMEYALRRPNTLSVLFMGDILKLNNGARINVPGIIDDFNWTYRLQSLVTFEEKIKYLRKLIKESNRYND